MDYPFDGPTNLEGAWIPWVVKMKPNKSGHHSKYEEIKGPVAEFLYTDILSLGCAQYGCRCKVLDCIYDNFQLGESVVSGIMSHSHAAEFQSPNLLLQTLCSSSLSCCDLCDPEQTESMNTLDLPPKALISDEIIIESICHLSHAHAIHMVDDIANNIWGTQHPLVIKHAERIISMIHSIIPLPQTTSSI